MALGGIISRKLTSVLKNVPNALRMVNAAKFASTRSYKEAHLEKIREFYFIANRDVFDRLNSAEFNYFISMTLGRRLDALDLRELFTIMDDDKDEYISMREINEHLQKGLTEPKTGDLMYAFCRFDKDFDNYIFLHEAREALFYLGFFQAGDPRIREFFETRDIDHDHRLTYEEFAELVKKDMPLLF